MTITNAKIQLQVALMLARDIQASRNGDPARFSRMVNAQSKQIMRRSDAISLIIEIVNRVGVLAFFPVTCRALGEWVRGAK